MTDKLGNAVKYGSAGAATGAAFGPYGAAAGGVGGAVYGYLSGGESDEEKAQRAAEQAKLTQDQQAAIAISNYRQTNRDQSHRLLQNRMAPYQEYSNRLAAGWGAGMSTAGLSAAENPVTLRDTGIGAAQGSNYTGWDEDAGHWESGDNGGNNGTFKQVIHHKGIGDYLEGNGDTTNGSVNPVTGFRYQDNVFNEGDKSRVATAYVDGGAGQAALRQERLEQSQVGLRQLPPAQRPGAAPPNGGFSFAPRRA